MKLNDIITINKVGLEEVTTTVTQHLLHFVNDCVQGLNADLWHNDEINSDFVSAITLALSVLDAENGNVEINEEAWATMVYTFEEREWAIIEEEEEEEEEEEGEN